jgi:hypothetical protein
LKSNLPLVTAINAPIKHKARDIFFMLSIFSLYIILENNAINRGEVYKFNANVERRKDTYQLIVKSIEKVKK